ncbi:VENN motif pre-toxin domain-containing protein [Gallibacterium anatis]|uniref:VENN motif pre-toxin domain-containing protein n=3 Tax=Gallibacterium anatis TaxID=750 RepID=UPI0038B2BB69
MPTTLARDTKAANEQVEKTELADLKTSQEMAQVIGEIANNGITIVLKPKLDEAERQKAEAEAILKEDKTNAVALEQKRLANEVIKTYGQGSQIQLAVRAVTGILQGIATGEATQAAVGGLSPYANQAIKQLTTDPNTGEVNTQANLMAHALLGAVEAYATGNNATAGAAGAVGGEVAAKIITEQLYQKTPEQLTEAQKQTVTALSQLASGLAGGLISDSTAGAINAAEIGKRAVENNFSLNYTNEELEGMAINAKAVVLQKELDQQVTEELKKEYPLIYQTAEGTYYIVSKTGKAMYIAREVVIDAVPMFIVPEIGAGTKFYTLLSRMAVSGSANLAVQKLSGQEFNPYEFTGAVVSGIVSPSFKTTSEAIRFNAGIGMAIGMANGGDGIGDAALAAGATYGAAKVSNPIWSSVISESIQKLPIIFNSLKKEERNNEE